jgi:hypothetical protein
MIINYWTSSENSLKLIDLSSINLVQNMKKQILYILPKIYQTET